MKTMDSLIKALSDARIQIIRTGFDGGMGMFVGGVLNGATIIWSFAGGWEHVSVCPRNRTATWDEMSMIKNLFWNDDEVVMQLHPAKSEYVNNMRYCLHLWKPIEKYSGSIPVPDSLLVGCKYVGTVG